MLRLAVQKICKLLGKPGKNINNDIAALVTDGLPVKVQQSLDILRVVGNNAVHPGELNLQDDLDTVQHLFKLINIIADKMITEPKNIDEIYGNLPTKSRDAIDKRDTQK